MKIVIRCDSSSKIGIGHVMRCLSLAKSLKKSGCQVEFICQKLDGNIISKIVNYGFFVHVLNSKNKLATNHHIHHSHWLSTSQEQDTSDCTEILLKNQIDWLIVDHYALNEYWERELKNFCKQLMVIDDLADRKHYCDLLLDQTLDRKKNDYQNLVPSNCRLLIGSEYALLRSDFIKWREFSLGRRNEFKLEQLLVNMGGVDNGNLTEKVLKYITECKIFRNTKIVVVMGSTAPYLARVKNIVKSISGQIELLIDVNNMAELMAYSDIAIGAPGSTTWERCCLGLPSILIVQAENQKNIANSLQKNNLAVIVDDVKNICQSISNLSTSKGRLSFIDMANTSSTIIDGKGVDRVLNFLLEL